MPAARRIRLELDPAAARAVHSAVSAALAAELVEPEDAGLARDVLTRLDRRVPDWLGSGDDPEAAIDEVLGVLATAEDGGRPALGPGELATALGAGGRSLTGLLERMSRERLVRRSEHDGREWIAMASAGRRRLGARRAATEAAPVSDPDRLVDVLYAEHRPGRWAHRPAAQAIARLDDTAFDALAAELRRHGLLEEPDPSEPDAVSLTDAGAELARTRWAAGPGSASSGEPVPHWRIPPPPLPYRPLPVRVTAADRRCPSEGCEGRATWLVAGGRGERWRALVRDGSVEWTCPACSREWLIYLQAHTPAGTPAYADGLQADHNRPRWRRAR